MIRPRNTNMKIGWITPTVGCFGAVREMVEVSNILIGLGHQVYIYHPDGLPCKWLNSMATCRKLVHLLAEPLDVLIGIVDWQPELYDYLIQAPAKVKAICLLGFEPTETMARALREEITPQDRAQRIIVDAMRQKFLILADSSWQLEWLKKNTGYHHTGPPFGGVNLRMFHPSVREDNKKLKIIYSGDPRERKGTDTVERAVAILKEQFGEDELEFGSYWNKKYTQEQLISFIQSGDIFLDAHRRAGWCNPVAEAIACGVVPVCTRIGANRDFAIDGETALVVEPDNSIQMAEDTSILIENPVLRGELRQKGLEKIKNFSYEKIVPVLEKALREEIND